MTNYAGPFWYQCLQVHLSPLFQDTHSLIVHQLLVKVSGWQRNDIPVSVDKIGVFFREVEPSTDSDHDSLHDLPPTRGTVRLVFAISLSDTQKVVNVRSALVLHNTMEFPLEVRLEYPEEEEEERALISNGSIDLPPLSAKGYAAIPLHLTSWNIKVRPQGWGVQYCSKHLSWKHVVGRLQTSHTRACEAIGESEEEPPFRLVWYLLQNGIYAILKLVTLDADFNCGMISSNFTQTWCTFISDFSPAFSMQFITV